jgi:hypothetical protein
MVSNRMSNGAFDTISIVLSWNGPPSMKRGMHA